jgi:hypothetical protein
VGDALLAQVRTSMFLLGYGVTACSLPYYAAAIGADQVDDNTGV